MVRDPGRLLPWLVFGVLVGGGAVFRALLGLRPGPHPSSLPSLLPFLVLFLPGAYLALLGLAIRQAATRPPATFASPAEGHFLAGSSLPPRLVVGWLQLRRVGLLIAISGFNLLITLSLLPAGGAGRGSIGLLAVTLAAAYGALQAVPMAAFLLSRRRPWLPVQAIGTLLAAAGAASVMVAGLRLAGAPLPFPAALATRLIMVPPGSLVQDAYHGSLAAAILLPALAAAAIVVSIRLSGDSYPELWESSTRYFAARRLMRQQGGIMGRLELRRALGETHPRAARSVSSGWAPGGAGAIVWKEWITMRRSPGGTTLQVLLLVGAVAAGALCGELAGTGHTQAALSLATGLLVIAVLIPSVVFAVRLGGDLRNPIWWLSASSLRDRLLAWTLSASLRQSVPAALGVVIALGLAGRWTVAAAAAPAVLAAAWTMRVVALASYALLPSASDLRGPGRGLRVLLVEVCMVPPGIALVAFGITFRSAAPGIAAAAVVAACEGWLLLEAGAWLIRRNGIGQAQAEAR